MELLNQNKNHRRNRVHILSTYNCPLYRYSWSRVNLKTGVFTTSVEPAYVLGSMEVSGVADTTTAAYQSEDISSAGLTKGKLEYTLHTLSPSSCFWTVPSLTLLILVYALLKDTSATLFLKDATIKLQRTTVTLASVNSWPFNYSKV